MSLNWKEINEVLAELDLANSFLQQIKQSDLTHLIFEFYKPGKPQKVLFCTQTGAIRFHRISKPIKGDLKPQRFLQFLRSQIKGGRVIEARQLGSDRIILLKIRKGDIENLVYLRLWGNAANILVTDKTGKILDCQYRRPGKGETTGGVFLPEISESPGKDFFLREFPYSGDYNQKLEAFYQAKEESVERDRLIKLAEKNLKSRIYQTEGLIKELNRKKKEYENPEIFKEYGDLITAHLYQLHKGMDHFLTQSYTDGSKISIQLNPTKSPQENAEFYYKQLKKAKSGLERVTEDIAANQMRLEQLEEELGYLARIEDIDRLRELSRDQRVTQKKTAETQRPGLSYRSHGFLLLVGRSAKENDQLLRTYVKGNDLWLHTRDYPGGYVFIKIPKGKTAPLEVLLEAGQLALYYSKGKNAPQADLYYTFVKYLRRAKTGKIGTVIPTQEKNIRIKRDLKVLQKIQSSPA